MQDTGERGVRWMVESLEVVRELPADVRWTVGRALFKAQRGMRHKDAFPLRGRLRGIFEIARDHMGDTYRVYYTLRCPGWVYVLFCHKKKSKRGASIPKHEADLILRRLRDCMAECPEREER